MMSPAKLPAKLPLDGYAVLEILYQGSKTSVYRAQEVTTQRSVVLKVLSREYPSFSELVQFRNQYSVTHHLEISGVVQTLSLEPCGNGYALVMEDFGGIDLGHYAQQSPLSTTDVLEIAIQLASILHELHQRRIIHKDIKPANILIHPESKQIKLTDFSIASLLPKETQSIQSPKGLEGTLAYLAPEQTGRMNRAIDYRADFYALGVTLYELFTGELPFKHADPMALIHCHIAQQAVPIDQVNPQIPKAIAAIVGKLMAKNAEDRYQSGLGLKHDLETCLRQWVAQNMIAEFPLGERDISDRFIIPEKLYGREAEVQTLLAAFDRVTHGTAELMLVSGFSGIGKTAVINEVHKPIVRQRGYFIKGKFDQFNRNIPFFAFVQAFRSLIGQLLSENNDQLHRWKARILEALGENSQVIVDLIPELESIIGLQPSVPELSGEAAQNRFNLLFQKFIQVFTAPEHPLVIFIDDLQWADSASLHLIQRLMAEPNTGYLLMLGAYRDNEVSPAHPLMLTLDQMQNEGASIHTITLQTLSAESLNHLIADTFHTSHAVVRPLADLVMQKTQGNPFFATQFLKALYQDELITFDYDARHWQCDIVKVRDAALTDDVVEFVSLQLQKLPVATQESLKLAACIGAQFDLETLAIVSEKAQMEIAVSLWDALQEGLVIAQGEIYKFYLSDAQRNNTPEVSDRVIYRFLHDRVQQAAYSLIPESDKQAAHFNIGTLLQKSESSISREDRLFEVVNHLNIGRSLLAELEDRVELSQLNLGAARKAKASTAYAAAVDYLTIGLDLLPLNPWQNNYALTLALHTEMAEAQYLNTDFEKMAFWAKTVLENANTLLDTIKVQKTRIMGTKAQDDLRTSLDVGLQVLQQLSVEFPAQPTESDIGQAVESTAKLWAERSPLQLIDLPEMVDAYRMAAMEIMTVLVPCAYRTQPALLPLLVCKQVEFSIQSGNCPVSVFAYADYSVILCGILGELEAGYEFGQLALAVIEKFNAKSCKCRAGYVINSFASHWKEPLRNLLNPFLKAYQNGLETGDLESVALNAHGYCLSAYLTGQELAHLATEIEIYRDAIRPLKQVACLRYLDMLQQIVANLLGDGEVPWELVGVIYCPDLLFAQAATERDRYEDFQYYSNLVYLLYVFDRTSEAAQCAAILASYLDGGVAHFALALCSFYDALIQLALYSQTAEAEQPTLIASVQQQQEKLRRWADLAPENHQHRWELVEAERYRVLGDRASAIEYYDLAIASAQKNKFIQDEALANEIAAKFYLSWGKEKVAAGYLQEAYYCYSRWGARAKIADLEARYFEFLSPVLQPTSAPIDVLNTLMTIAAPSVSNSRLRGSSSSASLNQAFDFASLLKASQILSRTIQLDELLQQLTQIILQNSGGDRCALIIPNDAGVWQVRAIATLEGTQLYEESLDLSPDLPVKLIQYVKNTQEVVVIDDLNTDLPVLDEYLQIRRPKSVLCLPILNQGRCIGILYLKNRMTRGVFTEERVSILNFLCTQAAISLENAQLYQQVQQALTNLQQAQLQLVQSEKMSALGSLVAGVAHEINNPVGCILGNVGAIEAYIKDLLGLLDLYADQFPEPGTDIEDELEAVDLDYLREDLPQLIRAMRDSGDRIKSISQSLRTFSRKDTDQKQAFHLHEGLESTLLILRHRIKANAHRPEIEIIRDYRDLQHFSV